MLSLSQLQDVTSIDEARKMLEAPKYDLRFELGYGRLSSSFEAKHIKQLVTGVCLQQIIYSNKAALDQLLEGLRSHQVNDDRKLLRRMSEKSKRIKVKRTTGPASTTKKESNQAPSWAIA